MKVSILVVDDEKVIGKMVSSALELFGYEVFVTDSIREAIELLQINQCDIVITDKNIPGLGGTKEGGLELLRYIKTDLQDTEVMMITGFPSTESTIDAIKLGACDYLTKPFLIKELKEKIDRIVEYKNCIDQKNFLQSYKNLHNEIVNLFERQDHLTPDELHKSLKSIKTKIDLLSNTQKGFEKIALEQREALFNIQLYVEQLQANVNQADSAYSLVKKIYEQSNKVIKPVFNSKPV
jgi:DNA-binding response OmpR family regulator